MFSEHTITFHLVAIMKRRYSIHLHQYWSISFSVYDLNINWPNGKKKPTNINQKLWIIELDGQHAVFTQYQITILVSKVGNKIVVLTNVHNLAEKIQQIGLNTIFKAEVSKL